MSDSAPYLTGQLLVALPGMGDPRFARSVIVMCLHDSDGAMGVDIGRAHDAINFTEVLDQLSEEGEIVPEAASLELLFGGPVEPQRGFVIHSLDYQAGDTVSVSDRFALSTTPGIVVEMGQGRGPKQAVLALGYAGWGPGQLEAELKRNGWIALDVDPLPLLDLQAEARWDASLRAAGIDPALLTSGFGSA